MYSVSGTEMAWAGDAFSEPADDICARTTTYEWGVWAAALGSTAATSPLCGNRVGYSLRCLCI